ncbi:MAG: hypothetical protein V2J55_18760 [Candidatus Competibacteraceae bacterium]|jgi:hypothetical protein|nr:hypothetical protein [Candidatus Competibacteraceae bacterium]
MLKRQFILLLALILVATAYFFSPYRPDREVLNTFYDKIRPWNTVRMELQKTRSTLRKDIDRLQAKLSAANQQISVLNQQNALMETTLQQLNAFHDQETQAINNSQQQSLAVTEQLEQLRKEIGDLQGSFINTDQLNDALAAAFIAAAKYHPVNVNLGALPVGEKEQLTFLIPESIPDTAREILVYVYIATNYVKGDAHDFKLFVNVNANEENAFYLHTFAFPQQGWSYNSENAWLPVPKDRTLRAQSDGKALFGSWNSQIRIIAYR